MKLFRIAAIVLPLFLAACLVPEKFTAAININPDGSYAYTYSGTAVHAMAAAQIKKVGPLSAKDEAAFQAEAAKMSKSPGIRRASYQGEGRYDLQIEEKKRAGERLNLLGILNVSTDKDGVMTISATEIKDKDRKELEGLGLKIDGTLDVKLPKNAEIISHNATSTPSFFGMFGAYSWKIGKVDQKPMMKLRLKS